MSYAHQVCVVSSLIPLIRGSVPISYMAMEGGTKNVGLPQRSFTVEWVEGIGSVVHECNFCSLILKDRPHGEDHCFNGWFQASTELLAAHGSRCDFPCYIEDSLWNEMFKSITNASWPDTWMFIQGDRLPGRKCHGGQHRKSTVFRTVWWLNYKGLLRQLWKLSRVISMQLSPAWRDLKNHPSSEQGTWSADHLFDHRLWDAAWWLEDCCWLRRQRQQIRLGVCLADVL